MGKCPHFGNDSRTAGFFSIKAFIFNDLKVISFVSLELRGSTQADLHRPSSAIYRASPPHPRTLTHEKKFFLSLSTISSVDSKSIFRLSNTPIRFSGHAFLWAQNIFRVISWISRNTYWFPRNNFHPMKQTSTWLYCTFIGIQSRRNRRIPSSCK
jgi:hypothetical protein